MSPLVKLCIWNLAMKHFQYNLIFNAKKKWKTILKDSKTFYDKLSSFESNFNKKIKNLTLNH